MDKTRAALYIIFLLFLFGCVLIIAHLTAGLVNNAFLLHHYEPPTQINRLEQDIIHDLQQRIEGLEDIFSEAETYMVTAYTHAAPGGDINGTGDGITASGLPVREGLVAVDPAVIPLGARVWVEGFGVMLAADTGGAIKGKRLDIFMDDKTKALRFKKRLMVVVL